MLDSVNTPTSGTDAAVTDATVSTETPTSIKLSTGKAVSNVERLAQIRYGNVSPVRIEIRYGKDDSLFKLDRLYIDYIKTPQYIRLTQEELDKTEDTSQMLE